MGKVGNDGKDGESGEWLGKVGKGGKVGKVGKWWRNGELSDKGKESGRKRKLTDRRQSGGGVNLDYIICIERKPLP